MAMAFKKSQYKSVVKKREEHCIKSQCVAELQNVRSHGEYIRVKKGGVYWTGPFCAIRFYCTKPFYAIMFYYTEPFCAIGWAEWKLWDNPFNLSAQSNPVLSSGISSGNICFEIFDILQLWWVESANAANAARGLTQMKQIILLTPLTSSSPFLVHFT